LAFIAVIFAALGVWIERQRHRPQPDISEGRNEKAIDALGLTNKEIARSLDISPNTVKTHLKSLYQKIGANNRTQAVSQAIELSIYSPV